ncbi:MAG: hypothetical protein MJ208_01995 [Bacilli bacterium]|nr:hypothetical protein [Bacilli bacterium]
MRKAICHKCNSLIEIDESGSTTNCPNCKEQIFTDTVIKNYLKAVATYRRKADIAFSSQGDYPKAYKNYQQFYRLREDDLTALVSVAITQIRCSTINKITIKEATDFLLKGSDKIEINANNINILNDALTKMKNDAKRVVNTFNEVKDKSNYALSLYHEALKQYQYYLKAYLSIYNALNQFNQYLSMKKDDIDIEINDINKLLKEDVKVADSKKEAHDFYNDKNEKVTEIFPNKKKFFCVHIGLYVATGVGAILSILGLIFLSVKVNQIATLVILCVGLLSFFGGYFINHYLTGKNKEK